MVARRPMFYRAALITAAMGFVLLSSVLGFAEDAATPNDTARFLAGMSPSADSPLTPLTKERAWQRHSRNFDTAFGRLDQRQLGRVRAWAAKNVNGATPTMFYMFGGPDFLYANAIYPHAKTYVLAGLEPAGSVPDLTRLRGSLGGTLANLEGSLGSILSYSFFITNKMKTNLRAGPVHGTLPVLYVFLARSGKTIRDVSPVAIDAEGVVQPDDGNIKSAARGVKIVFAGDDGEARTLYYFSTNLENGSVKNSGFLKFLEGLAPGDSLIKSASYLLHLGGFSTIRDFLLSHSAAIVQDDSGIPLRYYDRQQWKLQPFGNYLGPISLFPGKYQRDYAVLFKQSQPIDFGIGYRWRSKQSNLLLATNTAAATAPVAKAEPPAEEKAPTTAAKPEAGSSAEEKAPTTAATPEAEQPVQEKAPTAAEKSEAEQPAQQAPAAAAQPSRGDVTSIIAPEAGAAAGGAAAAAAVAATAPRATRRNVRRHRATVRRARRRGYRPRAARSNWGWPLYWGGRRR